ncbi:MAG: translation initiation factor [Fretibacterium sp.]|nr:translation initiation factor [Fretibacterium sp.]
MGKKKTVKRDLNASEGLSLNKAEFGLSMGELLGVINLPAFSPPKPTQPPEINKIKGSDKPLHCSQVVLQRTRAGRGGKWVTRVLCKPAPSEAQLEILAKTLRKALGSGSYVEEDAVIVQGDISDRLELWFREQGVQKIVS